MLQQILSRTFWRAGIIIILALALMLPGGRASAATLLWEDNFDGAAWTSPNSYYWGHDLGGTGWGNNELQCYTNSTENSRLNGSGQLIIEARYTPGRWCQNWDGSWVQRDYTSARLSTYWRHANSSQKYGRIIMRAKLPTGQGVFPAFWGLGDDYHPNNSWPQSGEIDIVENPGFSPFEIYTNIHGPRISNPWQSYNVPGKHTTPDISADYHNYEIRWSENKIEFYFDGKRKRTVTPSNLDSDSKWVFDKPFFWLVNVAVGGNWPGNPDPAIFPKQMTVDYVRAYSL